MELCKGWMKADLKPTGTGWTEHHYAKLADGTILACAVPGPTSNFGADATGTPGTWTRTEAVPKDAEFIGNYPVPPTTVEFDADAELRAMGVERYEMTVIGDISKGIDGTDRYIQVRDLYDDIDEQHVEDAILPLYYQECRGPGSAFCRSLRVIPDPVHSSRCIVIVQHRYDV